MKLEKFKFEAVDCDHVYGGRGGDGTVTGGVDPTITPSGGHDDPWGDWDDEGTCDTVASDSHSE